MTGGRDGRDLRRRAGMSGMSKSDDARDRGALERRSREGFVWCGIVEIRDRHGTRGNRSEFERTNRMGPNPSGDGNEIDDRKVKTRYDQLSPDGG
jgi:hypothetical protein